MYAGSTSIPARNVRTIEAKRGDEIKPLLTGEMKEVAGNDAEAELEQRDRDAELDRKDAGHQDDGP
jgi:hypothetical protein